MFRPRLFSLGSRQALAAVAAGLACLSAPGAARAVQPSAGGEKPHVYTDDDLKNIHKPPPPPAEQGGGVVSAAQPQTRPQSRPQSRPQTQPVPGPGPQTRASAAAGGTGKPEDATWAEDWRHDAERREFWQGRIRLAEDRVAQIEQQLEYLKHKKASIENPFLPRPALSPEDQQEERGMDGATLLARVQAQIGQAQQELEEARRAVEAARAEADKALAPADKTGWNNPSN